MRKNINAKKIVAVIALATMVVSTMAGCGKSKDAPASDDSQATQNVETVEAEVEEVEEEEIGGMGNPIEEVSFEKIVEVTGCKAVLPDKAEDITYLLINNELGEIRYTTEDGYNNMTLRVQKSDKFEDISGMYFDWTSKEECDLNGCECQIWGYYVEGEDNIQVAFWYDSDNKVMYSLSSVAEDLWGFDIYSAAFYMMVPEYMEAEEMGDFPANEMEARVGKTEFESYDEVISNLESGEAYALVKIKGYDGEVLLYATGAYDNLDGNMAAIDSTAYSLKANGKVTADTLVSAGGTAYPLSFDSDGMLYCYGPHQVETYCYGDNGSDNAGLMVMNYICVIDFDGEGNPTKISGFHRDPDNTSTNNNDGTEYDEDDVDSLFAAFEKYEKTKVINFTVVK